jgi:hypothetical protein
MFVLLAAALPADPAAISPTPPPAVLLVVFVGAALAFAGIAIAAFMSWRRSRPAPADA